MSRLEEAALSVLAGDALPAVAARAGVDGDLLRLAVSAYRSAGRAALTHAATEPWSYWRVAAGSPDLDSVLLDQVAEQLERLPLVSRWWFLRGAEAPPHLRVRVFGAAPAPLPGAEAIVYEPELNEVGGGDGLALAHDVFVTDTGHLLGWLGAVRHLKDQPVVLDRRDLLAMVLAHALLRGAQLDRFEQWDVWLRFGNLSTAARTSPRPDWSWMVALLQGTASGGLEDLLGSGGGELARKWATALQLAGSRLATAYREGRLPRGLRQVLASHLRFQFNRLGLDRTTVGAIAIAMARAAGSIDLSGRLAELRATASRLELPKEG